MAKFFIIMNLIDDLKRQLAYHEEQIRAIKIILDGQPKVFESSLSKGITIKNISTKKVDDVVVIGARKISDEIFPSNKSKRQQIIWLFENVFKVAVRMSDIQETYEKFSEKNDDITMTVRLLKGVKPIGTVKKVYGSDIKNNTFWGLSSWFLDEDFLQDFHPYG